MLNGQSKMMFHTVTLYPKTLERETYNLHSIYDRHKHKSPSSDISHNDNVNIFLNWGSAYQCWLILTEKYHKRKTH